MCIYLRFLMSFKYKLKFKFLQPEKATGPPSKLVNLLHNYESTVIMKTSVSSLLLQLNSLIKFSYDFL